MRAPFGIKGISCFALAAAMLAGATSAQARTATYDSSMPFTAGPMTALSTAGDGAGQFVPLNQWFSLLFAQPFGVSKSDSVSIYTLPLSSGGATFNVSFGVYNNGNPIFVETKKVNDGARLTVGNLFQRGCSAFGGCDFIFIETVKTKGGATGATVDYVSVNGEPTEVTAPTPEPSTWALMIIGFAGVAWRLKAKKRYSPSSAYGSPAM